MHNASRNLPVRPDDDQVLLSASGPAAAYLATDIVTATPHRLAELLYDSAIRLCRRGLEALEDGNAQDAADHIARAQHVVAQLRRAGHGGWERLYDRLGDQMVEAAAYRSREAVAATLEILLSRRCEWAAFARARRTSDPRAAWIG